MGWLLVCAADDVGNKRKMSTYWSAKAREWSTALTPPVSYPTTNELTGLSSSREFRTLKLTNREQPSLVERQRTRVLVNFSNSTRDIDPTGSNTSKEREALGTSGGRFELTDNMNAGDS
ncbi:hypothetical protein K435DRAFT_797295 [Dendrothele bispora CBS 962.96]|uniref:Uncharacterized protein n=1 Tax=Dendrothele bispora (strain CBS 962.96) TaxID=1314807 RepID=A0A4S8M422_DENBC|nr:hypothetical protein K435DRAFT_797295 [Dendrothele bispora CBS 962.96]